MAITAATRNDIIELVVTAYNAAPGTTLLNELVAIVNGGGTLADVAANLTTRTEWTSRYPAFQTAEEFAAEWLSNLVPEASAAALTEGTAVVVGLVNSGASFADIIVQAQTYLSGLAETDASFGSSAANFNNKVEVATHHTVTLETADSSTTAIAAVTSDDATVTAGKDALGGGAGTGGATFTLTSGTDAVVGTAGNDAINAAAGTLTTGDTINGGEGTDTLNITATGTAPAQTATTLSNVEIVNLTASPNPLSIDMKGVTGVTEINNSNSANGATVTVSNVGAPVNSTLTGIQAATTIGYTTAVTASTATSDKSTLTLAGTQLGASYTATGIEEVTVNSTKSANTLSSLGVSSATKLTIMGDQALTINGTTGGSKLASVDASAFTGSTLTLTAGNGVAGTASTGVAITLPTADTVTSTITAGTEKDTITLGAGNATVDAGGDNDTITSGAGTNTITGGTGNDTIKLSGTKDTLRYAETGASNTDTIEGFSSSTVIAVNLGSAQSGSTAASADSDFGVLQSGATSPTIGNVDGKGTGTAIVFQAVSATATTTSNPVAAGSNVLALNGAFTDGTAAGVVTALGTSATTAITTNSSSKFLVVTYSVGNIAQVWAYNGDDDADGDIDASELALIATLSGVTQNSLTASNFATYLTTSTTAGTVSNEGQTINVTTPLNTIQSTANANGHFLTAANDTITVATGMLPTGATTSTMGLTVIDPEGANDADTLSATVLNAAWDKGTLVSNIETVNLEFLTKDTDGFAMSSILPGTDTLNISGLTDTGNITNVISGTAFGIGSSYTKEIDINQGAVLAALTLNLNGGGSTTSRATFDVANQVTALTVNANASTLVNLNTNETEFDGITLKGSGNVTIFDASANIIDANITAEDLVYTGTFTLVPTDTSAVAAYDFTETGQDVIGLDVLDFSVADGQATAVAVTLPAVTGGGNFTIQHAPTSAAGWSTGVDAADLTVTQQGGSTNDRLTISLGANSNGFGADADLIATNTDTLTISSAGASTTTDTFDDITIASGAGTQTVTISGAGGFTLGDINADTVSTAGVGGAVSITSLTNTVGTTTFTGGKGNTTISATGTANQSITTGEGNDNITTNSGDDVVNAGNGTNTIITGAGVDTITGGTGVDTVTSGKGADSITLGGGADVVITTVGEALGTSVDKVTDFTGGTSGDKISIDISDAEAIASVLDLVSGTPTNSVAAGASVVNEIVKGTPETLSATDTVLVFTGGTFTDNTALASAISSDGAVAGFASTTDITFGAAPTAKDAIIGVYSDGTDVHVVVIATSGTGATPTNAELTITTILTLTGNSSISAGEFVAANFDFVA